MGERVTFSQYLGVSPDSNAILIKRNEEEIKLLEEMKSYIDRRSKIDAEYADKVSKLRNSIKIDVNTSDDNGFLHKVFTNFFIKMYVDLPIFRTCKRKHKMKVNII